MMNSSLLRIVHLRPCLEDKNCFLLYQRFISKAHAVNSVLLLSTFLASTIHILEDQNALIYNTAVKTLINIYSKPSCLSFLYSTKISTWNHGLS